MANFVTHSYFALKLMEEHKLNVEEQDHLIIGGVLPDVHLTGLIQYHRTHTKGKDFFHRGKTRLRKLTALGVILHGENPSGLDYYMHGWEGFIEKNKKDVYKVAKRYRKTLGKIDDEVLHHLTEFSIDSILVKRDQTLIPKILRAMKNPRTKHAITAFSSFHNLSEKKNRKIHKVLKNRHLKNFIKNFYSVETTAQNWLNLRFFLNLKAGRTLPFKDKVKKMTQFSFYNLKRKFDDKKMVKLFHELNMLLEERTLKFLDEMETKIKPVKDEYWTNIPD